MNDKGDFETWINHSLPVCAARTTTVSPGKNFILYVYEIKMYQIILLYIDSISSYIFLVINMALRKVLLRHQQTLEYRILRWKFEQNFVPTPRENWMQRVTLPSSLGMILILRNKM